jgi:hypothetical protein
MNVSYHLKPELEIIEEGELITLKSDHLQLGLKNAGIFDKDLLLKDRLLRPPGVPTEFDNLIFNKIIHQLIRSDFVEIQCGNLIRIEHISTELLPELLKRTSSVAGKRDLASNLTLEVMGDKFRITCPRRGLILTIKQKTLAEILTGSEDLEAIGLLESLGLFSHESLKPEILAEAFHFQTTRGLGVVHDLNQQLSYPWKGIPAPFSGRSSEFNEVVLHRKSSPIYNVSTPAWPKLNDWMNVIYGARVEEGKIKLNYPSAGRAYSVCLYMSYPEEDGNTLYSYDPFKRQFTALKKIPHVGALDKTVHIYLAGKTDQLKKKYKNISFRLLMLDAGVLLQQMSLSTSANKMRGRIVGFVHEEQIKTRYEGVFSKDEYLLAEYILFE